MGDEFGGNFITISDEDGNEFELEHLDTIEYNGQVYLAFLPADFDRRVSEGAASEEDFGMIILKATQENGEEQLVSVENEEELNSVYERFMESLYDEEEEQQ